LAVSVIGYETGAVVIPVQRLESCLLIRTGN